MIFSESVLPKIYFVRSSFSKNQSSSFRGSTRKISGIIFFFAFPSKVLGIRPDLATVTS